MTTARSSLEALINTGTPDESPPTTVRLFGMVRKGATADSFGFAIGSCDSWLELPLASVASMNQHGTQVCRDHRHHYVEIELMRPSENAVWFDILAQVLKRASRFNAGATAASPSGNAGGGGNVPMMRRLNYMSCFECWIRGGEADFCWEIGACR